MLIKPIKFDLNKYRLYEKLKAKQGDTESRFLLFQLLDGSLPFNLENRSVRAYMIKPDGKEVFNDLIINDRIKGYCTLELTNQVLAAPGIVKLELMVTEGTKKLTSSVFELEVEKSINSEKSIVSTNEFGALLKGLASLNEYDNYKNEIAEARDGEKNLLTKVKKIDEQLDTIETKKANKEDVARISNGTPLFASSITEMTDITKNYVNTADGYLYIYSVNTFIKTGVKYQEVGLSNNQVTVEKTDFSEKHEIGTTEINLNNQFVVIGQLSVSNGVLKTGVINYKATDFIDLTNIKYLFRYVLDGSSNGLFKDYECCFYDKNKVFISGTSRNTEYVVETYNGKYGCYYEIPKNAHYVRFSGSESNLVGGSGNLYTYLQINSIFEPKLKGSYYEKYTNEAIKNIDMSNTKPLSGKKIACFGDSIFGNFRDNTSIPSILGQNTGATVYNLGFGGTRMSGRNDSNSQAQYWDKFSFCRIVDYIESGDFSPMENALPNMSSALSYFQESINLLKTINWNEIDVITWEYGTNDFTGQNIVKNESDLTNLYTYYGAYCYSIEKLLTRYPHLRIILITPMWRFWDNNGIYQYDSDTHLIANQSLIDFVNCVKEVGQKYHLPVIDNYFELDSNKFTRGMYFNPTDGTHPHEGGRKRYGDKTSHQFEVLI